VFAMKSEDAEWWEKSAASSWLRFLEISRQFSIPASYEVIQLFRTTFAYDTVIVRLYKDIDVPKEWQAYTKQAAKEAGIRMKKKLKERLRGPTDMDYMALEQLGDMTTQFFFQVQRNIENPIVHFRNIVGKIAYSISLLLKLAFLVGAGLGLAVLADAVSRRWLGRPIDWDSVVSAATSFGWLQIVLIVIALVLIRRIVIRLSLPDTRLNPDR
jgi:hypothetical protein